MLNYIDPAMAGPGARKPERDLLCNDAQQSQQTRFNIISFVRLYNAYMPRHRCCSSTGLKPPVALLLKAVLNAKQP